MTKPIQPIPPTAMITRDFLVFDFSAPISEMVKAIDLNDIAWSLARMPRFNGHPDLTISVARHSMHVANIASRLWLERTGRYMPPEMELQAMLHDAAEAYTGDIIRPLRFLLGEAISDIEQRIDLAIAERFGFAWDYGHGVIVDADEIALKFEAGIAYQGDTFLLPPHNPEAEAAEFIRRVERARKAMQAHLARPLDGGE